MLDFYEVSVFVNNMAIAISATTYDQSRVLLSNHRTNLIKKTTERGSPSSKQETATTMRNCHNNDSRSQLHTYNIKG